MTTKAQALATIVDLTRTHQISLADITSALGRPEIEANKKDALTLTRLFSYLGGIFILAGLSAFITLNWDYLNTAARILVTLGPGIICLILAVVMTTQKNNNKNIPVLIILSALLQPLCHHQSIRYRWWRPPTRRARCVRHNGTAIRLDLFKDQTHLFIVFYNLFWLQRICHTLFTSPYFIRFC
jgi:hypothetical protein